MDSISKKYKILVKIYAKTFIYFFLFVLSAAAMNFLKPLTIEVAFLYLSLSIIFIYSLHKILNIAMVAFIQFNQIKKAVLNRTDTYKELSFVERIQNSLFLAPLSIIIGYAYYFNENILIQICILPIIFFLLLLGETAKYRYQLFKNWYEVNLNVN